MLTHGRLNKEMQRLRPLPCRCRHSAFCPEGPSRPAIWRRCLQVAKTTTQGLQKIDHRSWPQASGPSAGRKLLQRITRQDPSCLRRSSDSLEQQIPPYNPATSPTITSSTRPFSTEHRLYKATIRHAANTSSYSKQHEKDAY